MSGKADDSDVQVRMSAQRDEIYDHVVTRMVTLFAEEKYDSALAIGDEFFEWLDETLIDNEQTFFYDEDELKELYKSVRYE